MPIDPNSKEACALTLRDCCKGLLGELINHLDDRSVFNEEQLKNLIKEKAKSYPLDEMELSNSWKCAQDTIKECNENQIGILLNPDFYKITRRSDNEQLPILLFFKGNIHKSTASILYRSIAIIGSREIRVGEGEAGLTKNLKNSLDKLRKDSKHEWSIVSGLAIGCDSIAHKVALELDMRTIAVLPSGLNSQDIYPKANCGLAEEITNSDSGLLVSEYAPKTPIQVFHFPSRNKIQAAMSEVILVLDCHPKSGTIHTLKATVDEGKMIFHNNQIDRETQKLLKGKYHSKPIALEDPSALLSKINQEDSEKTRGGVQPSLGIG